MNERLGNITGITATALVLLFADAGCVRIQPGVKLNGIKPETLAGLMVVSGVFQKRGYTATVSSVCDGKHGRGSLHYVGLAFDINDDDGVTGQEIPVRELRDLCYEAADLLGPEWDCLHEDPDTNNEHLHFEYQPK